MCGLRTQPLISTPLQAHLYSSDVVDRHRLHWSMCALSAVSAGGKFRSSFFFEAKLISEATAATDMLAGGTNHASPGLMGEPDSIEKTLTTLPVCSSSGLQLVGLSDQNRPLSGCVRGPEKLPPKLEFRKALIGAIYNHKWQLKEKENLRHIPTFDPPPSRGL